MPVMTAFLHAALLLVAACAAASALSPSSYLSKVDKTRLAGVFESTWPTTDVRNGHYAAAGLKALGKSVPDEAAACRLAQQSVNQQDLESTYHACMLASLLKSCSLSGVKGIEGKLDGSLSAESLHQLLSALKSQKISFDSAKAKKAMEKIGRDDASAFATAHILQTALLLGLDKKEMAKYKTDVKDMLMQGDEADEQYVYYDKGLYTTAFVAEALLRTMEKLGEVPAGVPGERLYRLANYLLSRKQIYQVKSAAQLLAALRAFADSSLQSPVVIFLKGSATLSKAGQSQIAVQLADVWGRPVTDSVSVKVTSAKNVDSGAVFLKDAALAAGSERSVHSLDFLKANPTVGFYRLSLSATSGVKRLLLPGSVELEVKVVSTISVDSMEVWVVDREQHSQPATVRLQHPRKAAGQLEADSHQRLFAKFQLLLADGKPATVHQAFVRLSHKATGKEAIFVAEPDKQKVYKFSVDLAAGAKNFDYESGLYSMELIVGDALVENSLVWELADVKLELPARPAKQQADERENLAPKKVIRHVFRQPEKTAPVSVALLFTGLCLAPLALLLGLWAFLGVNLSGFKPSASALLFHAGLAGILGLYFVYWRYLNMFDTMRYLCLLGLPTFYFGNRLLRSLATERKSADA